MGRWGDTQILGRLNEIVIRAACYSAKRFSHHVVRMGRFNGMSKMNCRDVQYNCQDQKSCSNCSQARITSLRPQNSIMNLRLIEVILVRGRIIVKKNNFSLRL